MATVDINKTIFSEQVIYTMADAGAFVAVSNNRFNGDIRMGNTIIFNTLSDLTVQQYTASNDLTLSAADFVTSSFVVDRADSIFQDVDDLYQHQYDHDFMIDLMAKTGNQFGVQADQYLAGKYTGIDLTTNCVNSGSVWTIGKTAETAASSSALDSILELNKILDDNSVPRTGRWVIVPSFYRLKLSADTNLTVAQQAGVQTGLTNLNIDGTVVYISPNVAKSGSTYKVMAGGADCLAYGDAINALQLLTPEKRFSTAIKALHVYTGGIYKPSHMALLNAVSF